MSNLARRILVAALFGPAILWISYQGGYWLFGMVMLFSLAGIAEFLMREGLRLTNSFFWIAFVAVALLIAAQADVAGSHFRLAGFSGSSLALALVIVFFLLTATAAATRRLPPADLFRQHSRLIWGVLYVGLLYPMVLRVGRGYETISGGDCLLFLFGVLWLGDTAAMAVGRRIGRRQLAPAVSPRKTVEGLVGGLVGAAIVGVIMHFWKFHALSLLHVLALAVGSSLLGQLGDLVESMWKRSLGLKDSSHLIPGHGGVLDRFDSLLFAAPFIYAYFELLRP